MIVAVAGQDSHPPHHSGDADWETGQQPEGDPGGDRGPHGVLPQTRLQPHHGALSHAHRVRSPDQHGVG